jgi:prevent-host-death family protein
MADDLITRLARELGDVKRVAASDAKNQFGQVLETALSSGPVVITKHDTPKAILISIDEFEALTVTRDRLQTLTQRYDDAYARMQRPEARRATMAAFDATPQQLGAAAVASANKRAKKR